MAAPRPFAPETSPEAQLRQIERWRAMPSWRRAELVAALCRDCEELARAGVHRRHPDATPDEVRLRVAALRLGRALAVEAFGWDPAERGW